MGLLHGNVLGLLFGEQVMELLKLVTEAAARLVTAILCLCNCFAVAVDLSYVESFLDVVVRAYLLWHNKPSP